MTSRLLAALWVAVVMLSASATAASADGTVERSPIAAESFTFDALNGGTVGDPIDADALAAKMRAAEEEHEQAISTPAAEAERQDSIDAFTGLGRNAATALITDVFAEALDLLTTLPSDPLLTSESTPKFIPGSDTSVRIDPPGSEESQLVVSSLPLRNEDGQIISGKLKTTQNGFGPKAPLANVELPADANGAVALPDVEVEFSFADANSSTGQLVDAGDAPGKEMVLYPNTQTDTDTAVTYTLQGIETFNFLRSAESPESLSLDYELPDGAEIQTTADGGAIVLDSEGESLVTVFPPFAVDAQGSDVPMTLAVDGNSIVLNVPHRDEDFAYPIMVDPVQHVRNWWTNGSSDDFQGWTFHQEGTSNYASSLTCPSALASVDPCGGTGAGVYVSAVPGKNYPANSKGYWRWTAPGGPSSSIVSAVLDSWRYRKGNQNAGWAFYNVYNTNGTSNGQNITAGGGGSNLWMYGGNSGWKYLHSGLMTNTANTIPSGASNYRYNRIAAYTANLTDGEAPTLSLSGAPTTWLGPNTPFNVSASAKDPGLGMYAIQANVGGNWPNKWFGWCLGTYPIPCTTNTVNYAMPFNSNDFPSGVNWVPVKASDVVMGNGHETVAMFYNKVDKAAPGVIKFGNLFTQPELDYSFTIYALDGSSSSLAQAQSGVVDLKIYLDGMLADHVPATCTNVQQGIDLGSCAMLYNGTFNRSLSGYHVLKVEVTDAVGHKTINNYDLNLPIDTVNPTASVTKPTPGGSSDWLDGSKEINVAVSAHDADTGVTDLILKVGDETVATDEQECFEGSCSFNRTLKVPAGTLDEGQHSFKVIVKDGAGNQYVDEWNEYIDAEDPTSILLRDDDEPIWLPTADSVKFPANAEDSGSGISRLELHLTGFQNPVAHVDLDCEDTAPRTCPTAVTKPLEIDTSQIAAGTHTGSLQTVDGSGRVEQISVEVGIDDSAPDLEVSGDVMSSSPTTVFGSTNTLTFDVEDVGSGFSRLEVYVDDDPEPDTTIELESAEDDGASQTCDPTCNFTYTTDLELASEVGSGEHAFTFKAYDASGQSDTVTQTVSVDSAGPDISLTGALWDSRGTALESNTAYQLQVEAHDQIDLPRSALTEARFIVNDDVVSTQQLNCAEDCGQQDISPFVLDTATHGTDNHLIRVEVDDVFGNTTEEHFWVGSSPSDVNAQCSAVSPSVEPAGQSADPTDVIDDLGNKSSAMVAPTVPDPEFSEEIQPEFEVDDNETLTDLGIHAEGAATQSALDDGESGSIAVGNSTCITPLQTTASAESPTIVDGLAVYPNTAEDTDTLVRATMDGAVIVQNFKSSDAPTSFSWNVDLKPGQELRETSSGDVVVVDTETEADPSLEGADRPTSDEVSEAQNDVSVQNDLAQAMFKQGADESGYAVDAAFSVPVVTLPGGATIKGTLIKSSATTITAQLPANAVSDAAAMTFLAATGIDPAVVCAQSYNNAPEMYYEGCALATEFDDEEGSEDEQPFFNNSIRHLDAPDRSLLSGAYQSVDASASGSGNGGGLNKQEKKWCNKDSHHKNMCVLFIWDGFLADQTERYLWNHSDDGTRTNAFRHAVWVAFMVNTRGRNYQEDLMAIEFALLHEYYSLKSNDAGERRHAKMDIINDWSGWKVGWNHAGSSTSDRTACRATLKKSMNSRRVPKKADPAKWAQRHKWGSPHYFLVHRYGVGNNNSKKPTRKKGNTCAQVLAAWGS